ncbi:hypothetical protein J4710_02265 [Staphylococcus xylosus]|uniref:Uncharacterized protein n=1 Tax=Staphylococcus xylosus TaxID=1288 RepID=A0A939NBX2_STAXY|nr:hypothetical protein [Staphylococcus xylosus]
MVIKLLGYHGTDISNKDNILKNGFKYKKFNKNIKENRMPCDLGNGIYFYISNEFLPSPAKMQLNMLNYIQVLQKSDCF